MGWSTALFMELEEEEVEDTQALTAVGSKVKEGEAGCKNKKKR